MTIKVTFDGQTLVDADEATLRKRTIIDDTDDEITTATEYRVYGNDQVIHRSVHVQLKKMPVFADAAAASLK